MRLILGLNRAVTTDGGWTARIICRWGVILLAALALPGCSLAQDWEKPGATKEELIRLEDECEARALKRRPPAMITKSRTRTEWSCDRSRRKCTPQLRTETYSEDANKRLREIIAEACLQENGWTPIPGALRIRWMKFIRQLVE